MRKSTAMSPYHITLADDHVLLRQGLRRIIEESPDLKIVGEVGDGLELLQLLNCISLDMVVLDISMPNLGGLEAVGKIKARHPKVKVLMLTMHRDKEYLYQALSSGADGYILKDEADTELFSAIKSIREGRSYISPSLSTELDDYQPLFDGEKAVLSFTDERLTTREREVLKLIAEGKTSRDVAELLSISTRTVEQHRANIMIKLRLGNTADLVKYAIKKRYI